jgi:hypothetical protein
MNWVFMSQKTAFFIVTAVKNSNLILQLLAAEIKYYMCPPPPPTFQRLCTLSYSSLWPIRLSSLVLSLGIRRCLATVALVQCCHYSKNVTGIKYEREEENLDAFPSNTLPCPQDRHYVKCTVVTVRF